MAEELKDAIHEYLLENCTAPPRWFSEREIADALQVKRSAVREVLLFMEGAGAVRKIPKRGYCCVDYSGGDIRAQAMVRFALEHAAVMKALTAADDKDLQMLNGIMQKMEEAFAEGSISKYRLADMNFHTVLIEASHDLLLIKLFSVMKLALYGREHLADISGESMKKTHDAHRQLYDAFTARDFTAVEKALSEHVGGGFIGHAQAMARLLQLAN